MPWSFTASARSARLSLHDLRELQRLKILENDNLCETVQKLRFEHVHKTLLQIFRDIRHRLPFRKCVVNEVRMGVRGRNDNGVRKIDRAAKIVGESSVIKNLQEQIQNIRERFFELVKKDETVRLFVDRFRERAFRASRQDSR